MDAGGMPGRLERVLRDAGAALVGFADLSGLDARGFPRGVAVAVPLPPDVVEEIVDGPTPRYAAAYEEANDRLDAIVSAGAAFLASGGHRAFAQTRSAVAKDGDFRTPLPHKTVAARAGLGWIGKSCLLVTPQFGSAVRISSLLTDAPLPCAVPVESGKCGRCSLCVDACPAGALSGASWTAGVDRAVLLDVDRCRGRLEEASAGLCDDLICGRCVSSCRMTRRFLKSCRSPRPSATA